MSSVRTLFNRRSFLGRALAVAGLLLVASAADSMAADIKKIAFPTASLPNMLLDHKLAYFSRPRWNRNQLMAFSGLDGRTDYQNGLTLRTSLEPSGLTIVDPGDGFIAFGAEPAGNVVFSNDFFSFSTAKGKIRGCILDAHHILISGPVSLLDARGVQSVAKDGRILIGSGPNFDPTLIDADIEGFLAVRSQWLLDQRSVLADVSATTRSTLVRAFTMMKGQVYSPEKTIRHRWTTPDRWPHKSMWLWDSVFHAIGWRNIDPSLARDAIDAVLDKQRADGFIPHQMWPDGRSNFTQGPLLAYGMKLVDEVDPDTDWIRRNYPKLSAYIKWDMINRDKNHDGLVQWVIEDDRVCRSRESGMDNSPRFDTATRLDAVDFNSFLALECETLAGFADRLGYRQDAVRWRAEHKRLCQLINDRLWSEKDQFYCDYDTQRKALSPILSSAGFLPLICGAVPPERAEALARHLQDPDMFGTAFPVPSIPVRDTQHYSKDMWRGPTWVNINWLIARGLERYDDLKGLAKSLDVRTVEEIERTCETYGTFFEYFDDRGKVDPPKLLRKGLCAPGIDPVHQVMHEYGWTATLYVDTLFRTLNLKAPEKGSPLVSMSNHMRPASLKA